MVNFVGFHNPDPGAFFFFEIVSNDGSSTPGLRIARGDLLFGHFTATAGRRLVSNKSGLTDRADCLGPGQAVFQLLRVSRRRLVLSRQFQGYTG